MAVPIDLPFTRRNAELVRLGTKTCTTRRSIHGQPGDTFESSGEQYEILAVFATRLLDAAAIFHRLEGEPSKEDFLREWEWCYGLPADSAELQQTVYIHFFSWSPPTSGSVSEAP
jgi:hypothetical protein